MVLDKKDISDEARVYRRRLSDMGIAATVHACQFVSEIAQGTAGSATATGGLCSISIGRKAKRDYWVCENSLGSFNISDNEEYVLSYQTSNEFIGSTCWRF